MHILNIESDSPFLPEVIRLADENSATLGFLPRDAFVKHANDHRIFVAIDESDQVLGYLLYGTNQRKSMVYITHLCVDRNHRGCGIAKALFERLVDATKKNYRAIRVRCRREYQATNVWPKLGFHVQGEIPGRSKNGSTLTVWWFDFGHPNLFSYIPEQKAQSKLAVVIDANIFYDLMETPKEENRLSQALLSDWLDIEICLTNEVRTEINRNADPKKRQVAWNYVNMFREVNSPHRLTENISQSLRDLFPIQMSQSDESDLRQVSKTIAANILFFVTNDDELLKKSNQVNERFGVRIIRPIDLIIHQDALIRESEYHPARLAGSNIHVKRVSSAEIRLLEEQFQNYQFKKRSEFRKTLQPFLADPQTFEVNAIESGNKLLALIVYSRQNSGILEIPVLRIDKEPLGWNLAIHIINNAVSQSAQEGRFLTIISDVHLSEAVINALRENEFVSYYRNWGKVNLKTVVSTEELKIRVEDLKDDFPNVGEYLNVLSTALQSSSSEYNSQTLLEIERSLWPAKISDLGIPAYIVSIHPQWAMNLFDHNIANQTLFGADPILMLNVENVYYRSSRTSLTAPARILWYVNKGNKNFQGTMSIRACSYLDEVIIDKPKTLFSRFKRLGVYSWEDVYKVANQDFDQKIMAFRFSKTEIFRKPISRETLQEIWKETKGKNFNIQSPILVSGDIFTRIYKSGMRLEN